MSTAGSQSDDFEVIDSREASLGPDALERLQAWLQPTDYLAESSEFRRHLASQAPGTGLWMCDTHRFLQWHDSADHGSLWIKGVPGAGKSVIAASMIEHLRSAEDVPVLFFFFRYIIAANRRPRSLMRDWLAQLLPHSTRLQAALQSVLACELTDLSDERLWQYLLMGLSSVEKAYCVVDALDEMELVADDSFLHRLNNLATFRPDKVKLLLTSRPKQYLQSGLREASIVHINLEDDLVGKDIAHFVSYRLGTIIPESNTLGLLKSLRSTVCIRSQGLFLYARLLLEQIGPVLISEDEVDVEALVQSLPIGLEDMYNSMLFQQAETLHVDQSIQVFLLECAINSSRNLRLNELADFLEFKFPQSMAPGTSKAVARAACAPLLEIMEDETVQVIHHSFTEFLLDSTRTRRLGQTIRQFPVLDVARAHRMFTMHCLEYLQSGVLASPEQLLHQIKTSISDGDAEDGGADRDNTSLGSYDYQQARLHHPFLDYAVHNWGYHASKYDIEDEIFFSLVKTFREAELDFRRWLSLKKKTKYLVLTVPVPSLLHIAAFAGLTQFAKCLLQTGQEVDSRDAEGKTPLFWASNSGHAEIVSLLLNHGAILDTEDDEGVKPIHLAARQNFYGIVQMFLQAGVDPLSPKTKEYMHRGYIAGGQRRTQGNTAVQYACEQGHTETILVMIPFLQPDTLQEVLCETCRYGKFESARAVIENSDVSVNSKFTGATPLYLSCISQSVDCVRMLLERGADIKLKSQWSPRPKIYGGMQPAVGGRSASSPLQCLVQAWNDSNHHACAQIFQMLIEAGADVNEEDANGGTLLLSQFPGHSHGNGTPSTLALRTLLGAGANLSHVYEDGDTILHKFLKNYRDVEILDLFLKHGADITACGSRRYSVLHCVLGSYTGISNKSSTQQVIEYLLDKGAPTNTKDETGRSALEMAMISSSSNIEIFRLLLVSCQDDSIRRNCMWLIGSKVGVQQVRFIRELQAVGISLRDRNNKGETVLLSTMRSGDTWKALVECGADLYAIDSYGRGALHHSINSTSSPQKLQELIDAGLDPHRVDNEGKTILHIAAWSFEGREGEVKLIQYLLELGLSVNQQTKLGHTPLHINIENLQDHSTSYSFNEAPRTTLLEVFQKFGSVIEVNIQDNDGLSLLHLSAMRSEYHVARLLNAGADPTLISKDGRTALHLACLARRSDVVGFLLHKTKEDLIGIQDSLGKTALHYACASGRPESVYSLLKFGADVMAKDSRNWTPLHSCAEFGSEAKVWSLLQSRDAIGSTDVNTRYRPPPHATFKSTSWYASKYSKEPDIEEHDTCGIEGIVKLLLAAGADPLAVNTRNQSPLELSIMYDCFGMVKVLRSVANEDQKRFDLGPADLRFYTQVTLSQRTPIKCRDLPGCVLEEILRHPARYVTALESDDVDWLIESRANLTNGSSDIIHETKEFSLLHVVAFNGFSEIMQCLGSLARFYDNPASIKSRLMKASYEETYLGYFSPILHAACRRKLPNIQMLQVLVEKCGVDIHGRALVLTKHYGRFETDSAPGPTALHVLANASRWWNLEAIRYLIHHGADINSRDERGETPLHIACGGKASTNSNYIRRPSFWSANCVQLLLELGADPNALDQRGRTPLNLAKTNPRAMEILLERGADISIGKVCPLFSTIQSQHPDALRILLDAGADPNTKDISGSFSIHYEIKNLKPEDRSALFCASFPYILNQRIEDSAPLVKLLIERGADLYSPVLDGQTLIHYVFEHAEYEIIDSFLRCHQLVNFNARDQFGRTVFLAACNSTRTLPGYGYRRHSARVKAPVLRILEYGGDPFAIDSNGRHALHHLLENPQMEEDVIVDFLKHDATKRLIHQVDEQGIMPINSAFRFVRPKLVKALLEMGADLLQPEPDGVTALHRIAAQCLLRHKQQLKFYLQENQPPEYFEECLSLWNQTISLGVDINSRDSNGVSPLFVYLDKCNTADFLESYELLLSTADLQIRNNDGETALHIISKRDGGDGEIHIKLFEYMVARGLDPLAEDNRGRTSLDVAAACGKEGILDLFQYRT